MPDSQAPLILSLETATRTGSVALTRGTQRLALRAGEAQVSHSTELLRSVKEVLEEASVRLPDVEFYAVASGPGSFTGLRIGLATVKSFAATLKRSCAGIPTLSAVAHAAGPSARTLAMIPAGRGEVFAQLISISEDGDATPLNEALHQQPEKMLDSIASFSHLKLAGEAAHKYEALIKDRAAREGISLVEESAAQNAAAEDKEKLWTIAPPVNELATSIAALAYLRYRSGERLGAEQLKAIYVRPSDAELNVQQQ